jgi:hypothetical protein
LKLIRIRFGLQYNQELRFSLGQFSCRACCALFSLFSNGSQSFPATPCNMDATWSTSFAARARRTSRALITSSPCLTFYCERESNKRGGRMREHPTATCHTHSTPVTI